MSLRVERSEHIALVGANGAGKSTLLRILAGLEEPDSGTVTTARRTRISYLQQEPTFGTAATLWEAMLAPFRHALEAAERLRALEERMETGDDTVMQEYGRLQAVVEHAGYDIPGRIERVLVGLDLPPQTWQRPPDQLSGGQRTRANVGLTLLTDADLLLLDEPTNHLDIAALEWLEGYLHDLKRAFILVAHDRYLLDRVTRRTLDLSSGRIESYNAPYSRFLTLRAERRERQLRQHETQQKEIARTEEFIRRYGAGQRHKEARGRQKRLDRLERIAPPEQERTIAVQARAKGRAGDVALVVEGLIAGYPGRPLVRLPGTVVVERGQRVALIGANGSGKSTLLRTLVGELPPLQGRVEWGANARVGYYAQTPEDLQPDATVLGEIRSVRPLSEADARTYLARFLFTGDDSSKSVRQLSGGERSRLALAKLLLDDPNILLLDEPTNHLDIASRDALTAALDEFGGTLLIVSHDRSLIDRLARQLWVIEGEGVIRYAGNYGEWKAGDARPLHAVESEARPLPEQLDEIEAEVEALAGQIAGIAAVAATGQVSAAVERYAGLLDRLKEAQTLWLHRLRRESSG